MAFQQHKDLVGYVAQQVATRSGFQTPSPLLSGGLAFSPSTLNLNVTVNEEPRPDHTGRMATASSIVHAAEVEWDCTLPFEPAGPSTSASDASDFFAVGHFATPTNYVNSAVVDSGGATTSFIVSQISGISSGMLLPIETTSSSGKYKVRQVVSVSGTTGKGKVVIQPALAAAAVLGAKVMPSRTNKANNACDNAALTIWEGISTPNQKSVRYVWGAVPQTYTISWGNNTHPMCQMNGFARGYRHAATVSTNSAISTAVATTIKLTRPKRVDSGTLVKIDSEVMKLGAKTSGSSTYAIAASGRGLLGTVATQHNTGVQCEPHTPSAVLQGKPIRSPLVTVDVGINSAASVSLEGTEGTLTFGDAMQQDPQDFGDEWRTASYGKSDGDLKPALAVTGRLTASAFEAYQRSRDAEMPAAIVQMGNEIGTNKGMVAFAVPFALVQTFEGTTGDGKGSIGITTRFEGRGMTPTNKTSGLLDVITYGELG